MHENVDDFHECDSSGLNNATVLNMQEALLHCISLSTNFLKQKLKLNEEPTLKHCHSRATTSGLPYTHVLPIQQRYKDLAQDLSTAEQFKALILSETGLPTSNKATLSE
jgi:hypothetical protein